MATIRERGSSWQAQVRREGSPPVSKSFPTKLEATTWARALEAQTDKGDLASNVRDLRTMTVSTLLERYEKEIIPAKRGTSKEAWRVQLMTKHTIAAVRLGTLSGAVVARYRDERLKTVMNRPGLAGCRLV